MSKDWIGITYFKDQEESAESNHSINGNNSERTQGIIVMVLCVKLT
jgi:hypothetical protein